MKNINKNIKYIRKALKAIKSIEIEDYILTECHIQGVGSTFNERLMESQFQLEVLLNDLEEKNYKTTKYYRCRHCGKIIDDKEYHRDATTGMCFCEYSPESRILNPFFLINGDNQND